MRFRWNEWNIEHIAQHGISPADAEYAIRFAAAPFPRKIGDEKWLVWGRGLGGRLLQVVFVLDDEGVIYVIHARPLTHVEKRRLRRSTRQ